MVLLESPGEAVDLLLELLIFFAQIDILALYRVDLFVEVVQILTQRVFLADEDFEVQVVIAGGLGEQLQHSPRAVHEVSRQKDQLFAAFGQPHLLFGAVDRDSADLLA